MKMNNFMIADLKSETAITLLKQLATAHPDFSMVARELSLPELSIHEQEEIAKQTLQVLSEDPLQAQAIAKLAEDSSTNRFDFPFEEAYFLVGVIVLLRTHIEYQRNPNGTSKFKIMHKPLDSKMLTELLKKLSAFLPGDN